VKLSHKQKSNNFKASVLNS